MGKKQRATFEAILEKPNRKDIEWDDFIVLVEYLGATLRQRGGSAVGIRLNNVYAVFHQPHPGHLIYPTDLKRIRRFFKEAGVEDVE